MDSRDGRWMRDYGVKRGSGGHAASISMMKAGSRRAFCSRPRVAICCLRWCPRSLKPPDANLEPASQLFPELTCMTIESPPTFSCKDRVAHNRTLASRLPAQKHIPRPSVEPHSVVPEFLPGHVSSAVMSVMYTRVLRPFFVEFPGSASTDASRLVNRHDSHLIVMSPSHVRMVSG